MLKMCHRLSEPLDYWRYSFISFIIYPFVLFFFSSFGSVRVALSFSRVNRQQRDSDAKIQQSTKIAFKKFGLTNIVQFLRDKTSLYSTISIKIKL